MANIKITDLDAYTNPDSTDVLPIVDVDGDTTKKVTIADLMENAGAGTAALPGIAFDGDPNTGIYRPAADQIALSTAGVQRLLIDDNGDVTIPGGLEVQGTTTFINTTNLQVEDKNIELGKVGTPSDTTADGGGITLLGTTNHTINWSNSGDSWDFSEHVNIASGKEFKIAGTSVLSSTTLGSGVTASSLTSVGTITTGVWNGTPLTADSIGTGAITTAKVADDAINADKLANTTVTAGSYTAADITVDAQGRITAAANGTLGTAEIADSAITTAKIADTAVTTAKIADDAVTADKLANTAVTAGSYTAADITVDAQGRITAASSSAGSIQDKIEEGNSSVEVTDTGTNGTITFTNDGSESARFDSSRRLLLGRNSATTGANSANSLLQVVGGSSSQAQATMNLCRNENSADISLNELIGEIYFGDNQAGEYAKIKVNCDGTAAGADDYPGRIEFHTTADGASSPTERMRIDSSGRVRIGTGGTICPLNVRAMTNGNIHFRPISDVIGSGTGVAIDILNDATTSVNDLALRGATTIFRNASGETLRIDSSGRVGIGTSSPGRTLDVTGTARVSSVLTMGSYIQGTTQLDLYGDSSSSSGVRLDSSGRLGIGTTAPSAPLHINGTANNTAITLSVGGTVTGYIGPAGFIGGTDSNLGYRVESGNNHTFHTGATERARIDSSGRLLVGTSTSRAVGYGGNTWFLLEGTSYDTAGIGVVLNSNNLNGPNLNFAKTRGTSDGSNTIVQSGDRLGVINFSGGDGTDISSHGARIICEVDGTPGSNDMPGRLVFSTTADGASSPTERLRIANTGAFGLSGANYGTSGQVLTSQGSGSAPQWATPAGGKILQVASSTKTNTTSTSSTTPTNITNMAASFGSLASTSSKVFILVSLNLAQQNWNKRIHLRITGGNAASYVGDGNTGAESAVTIATRVNDSYTQEPVIMSYLDSPSTTSSVNYQVQWWVEDNTAYLNRPFTLDSLGGNCASTITIMEVGA